MAFPVPGSDSKMGPIEEAITTWVIGGVLVFYLAALAGVILWTFYAMYVLFFDCC